MKEPRFPAGWDADRVKRLIDHYDSMSDEELAEEDEAAAAEKRGLEHLQITKSTRHHKIIGDFGEEFLCNWLSRSGFEVAVVDHTGLDVLAYHSKTGRRLGISVKSRTRGSGKDKAYVTIFRKANDDRKKLQDACTAFACEPWIAVYVELAESAHLFLTHLDDYDREYRSRKAHSSDTWKMSKALMSKYVKDPSVWHLVVKFEASNWEWSKLGMKNTAPMA